MEYTRFLGWDVHAETIVVAEALAGRGPARDLGTLPHTFEAVRRWIERQPDRKTLCIAYEAGPTGFGLARWCAELGVTCLVVAPGLVPRRPTDRVKTDRRDARQLALDLRAGLLTPIRVPTAAEEAFRDLVRARARAVDDRRQIAQRIRSTLLRWGIARPARCWAWSPRFRQWLRTVTPTPAPRALVWQELLTQLEECEGRIARLDQAIQEAMATHPLAGLMTAWQALRGVAWITAATMAAECGDLTQFPGPPQLTSFLGLVPTEWSSGGTRRQGGLTKTGNVHVRRVLVEAAWSYRYHPIRDGRVGRRWATLPTDWRVVLEPIGWRAQQRLHARWRRLVARRGWSKAAAALARELCGYFWEIAVWWRAQEAAAQAARTAADAS